MAERMAPEGKLARLNLHLHRNKTNRCALIMIKPLRILQFSAVLLLLAFTIYMIAMDPTPISVLACILLIVLSGIYVFVLAVELISHFTGGALHIIPMFAFSLFGLIFFGVAGILLIFNDYTQLVVHLAAIILCLLAALLFLIDITTILIFWKRKCPVCKRCCINEGEYLYKTEDSHPPPPPPPRARVSKRDITTSVSDVRVPAELKGVAKPSHDYRKVEYPRRREYVDSPTCVPSLCNLEVAQIQTEPRKTSVVQSQTPSRVVKETPMQTFSKCHFCHQPIQTAASSADEEALSYPAIVQFVRGGVNIPCCPGCKCNTTGTAPQTQQQPQPRQSRPSLPQYTESPARASLKPEARKASTSEAAQQVARSESVIPSDTPRRSTRDKGLPQTITRLTVASIYMKPDSKRQTSSNHASKRKSQANPTGQSDQDLTEEIIAIERVPKDEEPAVEQLIDKKREENTEREEELVKGVEYDDKIERSRGGGEECRIATHQQSKRTSDGGSMSNFEGSPRHMATQISETLIVSGRSKSKTFLHLKSNKVDPIRDSIIYREVSDKDPVSKTEVASRTFVSSAVQKGESSNSFERQTNDVCSHCKRQILTPISINCCNIFRDKNGRYFCEFCATADSKRITSRLEVTDLKKLRCANCRLSIRAQGAVIKSNVKPKSDACPKCGQSQRQTVASSPSSM